MRIEFCTNCRPSRRQIIALGIGALAVATVPFVRKRRRRLTRRTIPVMGTLAEIGVVHSDEYYSQQAMDAAFAELRLIDQLMTRFDERSEVGRANGGAAREGVPVSERTAHVLGEALAWAEVTGGRFDPCLGNVMRLWDVGDRSEPPAERDVRKLAGRGLYRGLDLSRSREASAGI